MVQREADRQRARRVARAGDFLQVAVKVFALGDSPTLTGAIGLFAEAGGSTGGETPSNPPSSSNPDGGTSIVTAPASLRIRNALRGIRISVNVPGAGARVVATLSARGIGRIASVRRSGVAAGS